MHIEMGKKNEPTLYILPRNIRSRSPPRYYNITSSPCRYSAGGISPKSSVKCYLIGTLPSSGCTTWFSPLYLLVTPQSSPLHFKASLLLHSIRKSPSISPFKYILALHIIFVYLNAILFHLILYFKKFII